MFTLIRRAGLLCLAALLAACAAPVRVGPPPGALVPGQTITLVRTAEVKQYTVYAPHAGMAFGAIGGLVAGLHMEARAKEVRELMLAQKLLAHDVLTDAVAKELQQAGFRVNVVAGQWTDTNGHLTLNIDKMDRAYERIMLLAPGIVGFWAGGMTGNYQPAVRVRATLTGQDRKKLLYDAHHFTGFKPPGEGWIYVAATGAGYASYDALISNPAATAASLRQGLETAARSVVQDMLGVTPARAVAANAPATSAPASASSPLPSSATSAAPAVAPTVAPAARTPQPVTAQVAALGGAWTGFYGCGAYVGRGRVESPAAWTVPVTMTVEGARATMTRGNASYSETIHGDVGPDLAVQLQGKGAMQRAPEQPWVSSFAGRFNVASARFDGTGTMATASGEVFRHCTIDMVKR